MIKKERRNKIEIIKKSIMLLYKKNIFKIYYEKKEKKIKIKKNI